MLAGLGPLGPRGPEDGPPALVIPGFLATDRTTMDVRRALARAGWRVHPWLLGVNMGAKADTLELLGEAARGDLGRAKSAGGRLEPRRNVRAAARAPLSGEGSRGRDFGSPFSGDLKTNTNVREYYERIAGHDVYKPPFPHITHKPPVPTLALWSRRDGIVAPSAARGRDHERDKAVEIDTYHMGFAVHRPVLSQVVDEIRPFLAEAEGRPPALQPMVIAGLASRGRRTVLKRSCRFAALTLAPDSREKEQK